MSIKCEQKWCSALLLLQPIDIHAAPVHYSILAFTMFTFTRWGAPLSRMFQLLFHNLLQTERLKWTFSLSIIGQHISVTCKLPVHLRTMACLVSSRLSKLHCQLMYTINWFISLIFTLIKWKIEQYDYFLLTSLCKFFFL